MDFFESVLRTISALAVVLGLMTALVWALRRFGKPAWLAGGRAPLIDVLATASLGPRKTISLISVAGEVLIIGSSATEVVRLGRVRDPERVLRAVRPTDVTEEPASRVQEAGVNGGRHE